MLNKACSCRGGLNGGDVASVVPCLALRQQHLFSVVRWASFTTYWLMAVASGYLPWLMDHNESRPHRALNNLTPFEYVAQLENGA